MTTQPLHIDLSFAPRYPRAADLKLLCLSVIAWLSRAMNRSRQRERLMDLDTRILQDIGVTHEQARCEAAKPFWK